MASETRVMEVAVIGDNFMLPEKFGQAIRLNSNKGTKCDIEIRVARIFAGGVASAVYEPVGSTPSPPHSLSGEMIALNHPNRSVR